MRTHTNEEPLLRTAPRGRGVLAKCVEGVRAQSSRFWIAQIVFLLTGVANNTLANQIDLMGAGDVHNGLIPASLYLGQFLFCALFAQRNEWKGVFDNYGYLLRRLWKLLLLDIVSCVMYYVSLDFLGSGMSTVLYSSIVIFTAIFQRLLFSTKLSAGRWIAVILVPVFVSVSAVDQVGENESTAFRQTVGCVLIILSALGYAMLFVMNNYVLRVKESKNDFVPSSTQVSIMYSSNVVFFIPYILGYVLPRWRAYMFNADEGTADPGTNGTAFGAQRPTDDEDRGWMYGNTPWTIAFYAMFVISIGAHQVSFYHCLGHGPAAGITTGISKALQAAGTFLLSDAVFCASQHDQCLSTWKALGAVGIVTGVSMYATVDVVCGDVDREEEEEAVVEEAVCGGERRKLREVDEAV